MDYLKYVVAVQFLINCYAADSDSRVAQAFLASGIVPNIEVVAPEKFISVNYSTVAVDLGNRISPIQTLSQPDVSYEVDPVKLYTFIFFGPDVPLDVTPRYTQFLHWLIVNIQGTDISTGDTVSAYFPPVPYPGGFFYSFLLYEQSEPIDPVPLERLGIFIYRPHFDPVAFKGQNGLIGPIAGNFMRQVYLPPITVNNG